jgi:hypothetical protein
MYSPIGLIADRRIDADAIESLDDPIAVMNMPEYMQPNAQRFETLCQRLAPDAKTMRRLIKAVPGPALTRAISSVILSRRSAAKDLPTRRHPAP